ncbi:N-formylglutamate amidohydrolase [Magnetovibrio sp.]|uniref:N-formylglutamate amidohydrolase n=1 Tax=Magnetovibrio sp. TaxID=2024836 RepID=UPI002F93D0AB
MSTTATTFPQECSAPLLRDDEPGPFEIYNPGGHAPFVIVSDHASRRVPQALNDLGLSAQQFDKHIAYDIGADMITRRLADRLDARAVMGTYSRLVIDLNRQPGDPGSIPEISDGVTVPANQSLSEDQVACRIETLHTPYHEAINREIAAVWRRDDKPPALFSIHSFTPTMNGQDRVWDIGVLWNRDPRLAVPLIEHLRQWDGLHVGDNEPYSGRSLAYTIDTHGAAGGLANCAVEIRQDHCATAEEASHWADILADALRPILALPGLHEVKSF